MNKSKSRSFPRRTTKFIANCSLSKNEDSDWCCFCHTLRRIVSVFYKREKVLPIQNKWHEVLSLNPCHLFYVCVLFIPMLNIHKNSRFRTCTTQIRKMIKIFHRWKFPFICPSIPHLLPADGRVHNWIPERLKIQPGL